MTPMYRTILSSYLPPLEGSEIRMVKISARLRNGLIDCTLFCAELELDEHPEFYPLSYVWGDPEATVPIFINNAKVNVTINLHRHGGLSALQSPVKRCTIPIPITRPGGSTQSVSDKMMPRRKAARC